jgi:hypothetical protein
MKDECINCGAWKGLHHYETNQCPRNGQEAQLGKLQEWDNTVYQEDNTAELRARIATLEAENARLTAAHAMQGEELVTLPRHMVYSMEDKLKEQSSLLRRARIALTFYREWSAGVDNTRYPFGDEVENEIRATIEKK